MTVLLLPQYQCEECLCPYDGIVSEDHSEVLFKHPRTEDGCIPCTVRPEFTRALSDFKVLI